MGRIDPGMELRPHITCILCDPLPEQRHSGFTFQHRIIDHMNWPHASAVQIPLPFGKSFEALDGVAGAGKGLCQSNSSSVSMKSVKRVPNSGARSMKSFWSG